MVRALRSRLPEWFGLVIGWCGWILKTVCYFAAFQHFAAEVWVSYFIIIAEPESALIMESHRAEFMVYTRVFES